MCIVLIIYASSAQVFLLGSLSGKSVIHCSLEQLQKYLGVTEHVKIARDHPPHGHSFWQWVLFMDELWLIKPGPKLTEIKGNSSFGFTGLGLAV